MDYVVQPGDTISLIASRFSTTLKAVLDANPLITDPSVISAGQTIIIPENVDCGTPQPEFNCPTLKIGSKGLVVTALQDLLKNAGFNPGAIDGIFGVRTKTAVITFQRSKNLVPDGVVGVQTWTALGANCKTT